MNFKVRKIRFKLLVAFFSLIFTIGIVGVVSYFFLQNINQYQVLKNQIDALLIQNLELRKFEQNFILNDSKNIAFMRNSESANTNAYQKTVQSIKNLLTDIENQPEAQELDITGNLTDLREQLTKYNQTFNLLADKIQYRGFKDLGLEGQMREAVHSLEDAKTIDRVLLLTLRRNEKDFIIRKDMAYAEKVHETANLIKMECEMDLSAISTVNDYEKKFDKIVAIEKEIGLNENDGLRGLLTKVSFQMETELNSIHYHVKQHTEGLINSLILAIMIVLGVMLFFSSVFALYFSYSISLPITTLDRIVKSVVKDFKNQEKFLDKIDSKDEIGDLAQNFKIMLLKLKRKINQANERSEQLEEIAKGETQRNWHNEGLSIFNEIFRNHYLDLERQTFEIISQLVKYTKSNQGGIFVVNRDDANDVFLELRSCYAYERRRYQKKRIELGDGLIGTVWREGETILITDIPQDYVTITSGLGQAKPNCLLIVPIKTDDSVEGIIELVSFKEFSQYEINFIDVLAQKIATSIVSIKSNEKTKKLLVVSETIAKEAKEKEAQMQKQIQNYEYWVQEFEQKLNQVSEEALIYQSIVSKVFAGLIITDDRFVITKVNHYISKRFGYNAAELVGQSIDLLIETDHSNIIDLKSKRFKLNYNSFRQSVLGKVIDQGGKVSDVEMISGKLEIEDKLIYVFLFNEYVEGEINDEIKEMNSFQNPNNGNIVKQIFQSLSIAK